LVYNYFTLYGLGETHLVIHADNCARQNKNNAMIMYSAWQVACGLHIVGIFKRSPKSRDGRL